MTNPTLPRDAFNNPIPAVALKKSGGAHQIAASASSARNATAFAAQTKVVYVYATVPVYLRFGGSTITAANTDHYYPAGAYIPWAINADSNDPSTHLAVLRAGTSDGTVYVSETE